MDCLVTRLKAVVNNPNLPILETMQQFTLDAITASGNSTMTDAQKWALNHFFYQMGAISNSELWQKIKFLGLPIICNDNLNKALTNYVDNTDGNVFTGEFVSHGLVGAKNSNKNEINYTADTIYDICALAFYTKSGVPSEANEVNAAGIAGGVSSILRFTKSEAHTYLQYQSQYGYYESGALRGIGAIASADSDISFLGYADDIVYPTNSGRSRATDSPATDAYAVINGLTELPTGISITAIGLTVAEGEKIMKACATLVEAFVTE